MIIPSTIKKIVNKMAKNAQEQRDLNKRLTEELELLNIDVNDPEFISAFSYIEGDCAAEPLLNYLEMDLS